MVKKQINRFTILALFVTPLVPTLIMMLSIGITMMVPFSQVIDRFGKLGGILGLVLIVYLVSFIFTFAIAVMNYFLTYLTNGEVRCWLVAFSGMAVGGTLGLLMSFGGDKIYSDTVVVWMFLGVLTGLLYWFFLLITGKRSKAD